MNIVKTYHHVNTTEGHLSFGISKMEDIYSRRNGKVDAPHRHAYYTILIIGEAHGQHKIDFNTYPLDKQQIFFVAPGQVHQVIETMASKGYSIVFSHQFLIENGIPLSFIDSLNLFQNYGQSPPLIPEPTAYHSIYEYCNQIYDLHHSDAHMKQYAIGAYIKLLLIACNNICAIHPFISDIDNSGDNLLRSFKKLVEAHYQQEHSTTFYAQSLFITADHLNRSIKQKIGKTAKDYIQARIITEAKRLLYFTELSNKEIGYSLGFSEPANFSAFFKKNTGLAPSHFKESEIST